MKKGEESGWRGEKKVALALLATLEAHGAQRDVAQC